MRKQLLVLMLFFANQLAALGEWSVVTRKVLYCEAVDTADNNPTWYKQFEDNLASSDNPLRSVDYTTAGRSIKDDSAGVKNSVTDVRYAGSFIMQSKELCRIYELTSRRP